ncbi:MAG: histidinol-phosphatase [Anaerolineales bacterium]
MIPLDYHMHTTFSEDGSDSLEAMCLRAVGLGIPEVGFSEHWDVGPYEKNPRYFQPETWFMEINRLRTFFEGQLIIRAGVEVAEPHLYPKETAKILAHNPFDYVFGSVHFVGRNFVFDDDNFRVRSADEVYKSYFTELELMIKNADIDIVAHFDIPSRTGKPIFGYAPARYETQIRSILKMIIKRNLALEVNTGGLRKSSQNLMPDPLILKWYAAMGGERLTLGSDAHAADQVGLHLEAALEAIRAAGLSHLTQFVRRNGRQIPM